MSIKTSIDSIRRALPDNVTLVAVSKTKPMERLQEAYDAGERIFGENKVQELVEKYNQLPKDIAWHMIGHLQSNKVKFIAPFIALIHAVDSFSLLQTINKEGIKCNRKIPCLLQFHIAREESKFGMTFEEASQFLQSETFRSLHNVEIRGVMGMATFTDNQSQVRNEFRSLKKIFDALKADYFSSETTFDTISMGMSDDYEIAIEEGSTMVRIGSSIFGVRDYTNL